MKYIKTDEIAKALLNEILISPNANTLKKEEG